MSMQVEFDDLESVWHFHGEQEPNGSPVTAVLHGVGWTVGTGDPGEPIHVAVEHPATDFARAAIAILLGSEASAVLDAPPPDSGDEAGTTLVGRVPVSEAGAARRTAVGLLALGLATPDDHPLRAIDTAVLLRRARLDGAPVDVDGQTVRAPLPSADDLADDADEALDMVPAALLTALEAAPTPTTATAWAVAQGALRDARSYVVSTTGDLLAGIDVEQAFEAIAVTSASDDDGGADDPRRRGRSPVFLGGDGDGAEVDDGAAPLPTLLADPLIRGIVTLRSSVANGEVVVQVATRPGADELAFRAIGAGDRQLAAGRFELDERDPSLLIARVAVEDDAVRVEIVRHLSQPVGPLTLVQAAHRAAVHGEAERVLAQVSLAAEQTDEARRAQVEELRSQVRRLVATLADDAPPGGPPPASVIARPSAALQVVLAENGDALLSDLEQIADPATRAIRADEAALLLADCVLPWAQQLLGRVRMVEAEARVDGGWGSPTDVARRAVAAFTAAGDTAGAARARAFIEGHRAGDR